MEITLKNSKGKSWKIGPGQPVFIVAEIGKNFIRTKAHQSVETYLDNAKKLVDEAKIAGADAVKFQTHNVADEQLNIKTISPHFKASDRYNWVLRNTLATPVDRFWKPLKDYCDKKKILFFSTPMSRGAAKILDKLGAKLWKVGSGDVLDFVMLDYIAKTGKPIILSSGMSSLAELKKSIEFIKRWNDKIILLHAVSRYPCPVENLNLRTINFLAEKFNLPVGFSDHSLKPESAALAVALGARVVEKHFSLSRSFWGADHKVSLTPREFKKMVDEIRKVESDDRYKKGYLENIVFKRALGRSSKILQREESVFRPIFRKSLVAANNIQAGIVVTADLVYAVRPQKHIKGLASEHFEKILGKKLKKDLKKYEPITHLHFQ